MTIKLISYSEIHYSTTDEANSLFSVPRIFAGQMTHVHSHYGNKSALCVELTRHIDRQC